MQMSGETSGDAGSAAADCAPLISIVIPVYNAASDLPGCLDSITGQSFSDFEIIAVNGGSTDRSGEVLAARAAADDRMAVVHVDDRGPGNARNIGAQKASGRYLWFVDADDSILPGSLEAIAGRLESAAPDVLLMDYELLNPDGSRERGPDHTALTRDLPPDFTAAERTRAIDLTMASWNKVVRTEFFRALGLAFDKDWPHEDIRVTCLLLLHARRLSTLGVACYRYRKGAPGSLMTSGARRRHFRAFEVWHGVLDQVRKMADSNCPAVTDRVYSAWFSRAIVHCSYLLDARARGLNPFRPRSLIAPADRREFFEKMQWAYVHYRPADFQRPGGLPGVKFGMIERDRYRAYSALAWLNRRRLAVKRRAIALSSRGSRW